MKVRDIMTKNAIYTGTNESLDSVLVKLSSNGISGCPVVTNGKIVGIITESDIVSLIDVHSSIKKSDMIDLIVASLKSDSFDSLKGKMKDLSKKRVGRFMNKKVVTIMPEQDIYEAAKLINKHNVNRLPVVDKTKKLKGVISRADIIKALAKE